MNILEAKRLLVICGCDNIDDGYMYLLVLSFLLLSLFFDLLSFRLWIRLIISHFAFG